MAKTGFMLALRDAMSEEMRRDNSVFLMGEDVCHAIYGSSVGMLEEFGAERVLDVPLAENGFVGVAGGAAMIGMRPIVDITISPFLYLAADQIISIISKSRYIYGGQTHVPLVLRSCMMYNINNAAQHSDRPYPMFANVPGLKIVAPSDPYDAKGLLKAAIRDDDPVLFFEDASLWTSSSEIPDEDYVLPLGKAAVKRPGNDVTVFAIAGTVPIALRAAEQLASEGIDVEVIDPRTLKPLDTATVLASLAKTGRFVAVDPAHRSCSLASEITAVIAEKGFWNLKAPPLRVTTPDIHIPFAASMEKGLFPNAERIIAAVKRTMAETA